MAALANGATRLRLAGREIAHLGRSTRVAAGPVTAPAAVLTARAEAVTGWYGELADSFVDAVGTPDAPGRCPPSDSFLDVVLPAVEGCGDAACAEHAERLLWSGQYLGDVDRLRGELVDAAAKVHASRVRPWWNR